MKQEKAEEVERIKNLIESYSVIGVLNMHKLPARQMQQIKHSLDGTIIKMSRKTMTNRALEKSSKKDIIKLKESLTGPAALIFTNDNPFRLFKKLKQTRSPSSAKAGDIASKDIVVQKGSTGLPPGPAISVLQKIGLKASVQGGKIAVLQDKAVCKAGEMINEDVAKVLALLKIQPLEIGLDLLSVYEDGVVYSKSVLDVDKEAYISNMQKCISEAMNLSLNTGYPTKETIELMITKAFLEIKSLCIKASLLEKDFIGDILINAIRQASVLEKEVNV